MLVVGLMVIGGFLLFYPSNMQPPFAPFGVDGVLRGATSSFFGYVRDNDETATLESFCVCAQCDKEAQDQDEAFDTRHNMQQCAFVTLDRPNKPNILPTNDNNI